MQELPHLKSSVKNHPDTVMGLSSLSAVQTWDAEAGQIINSLHDASRRAEQEAQQLLDESARLDSEHKALSFWKRFTTANKSIAPRLKSIQLSSVVAESSKLVDDLESWVERTPNSVEEAKLAISEFSMAKKELAIQIKELAAEAKGVRQQYSQKSANISASWGNSKSKQFSRSMARLNKERELGGIQNQKAALERQVIAIEKIILWMQRIIANE